MTAENQEPYRSPEGFTHNQEILAGMLFDTPTHAPVRRRRIVDGQADFYKIERDTFPVDFAQEGEFVLKKHETDSMAELSPSALQGFSLGLPSDDPRCRLRVPFLQEPN